MARGRRSKAKSILKLGGIALAVVVGYDLYKGHTGLPAPTTNSSRLK